GLERIVLISAEGSKRRDPSTDFDGHRVLAWQHRRGDGCAHRAPPVARQPHPPWSPCVGPQQVDFSVASQHVVSSAGEQQGGGSSPAGGACVASEYVSLEPVVMSCVLPSQGRWTPS